MTGGSTLNVTFLELHFVKWFFQFLLTYNLGIKNYGPWVAIDASMQTPGNIRL